MKFEDLIIGQRLKSIEFVEDYIQLIFFDDVVLNVFNPFVITSSNRDAYLGLAVSGMRCESEEVSLFFGESMKIVVSVADSDYSGPEAMLFSKPGEFEIVW